MTAEQFAQAFQALVQQQSALQTMITEFVQAQAQGNQGTTGDKKPWHSLDLYRNIKPFTGEQKD